MIRKYLKNNGFNENQIGSSTFVLAKEDIHIFYSEDTLRLNYNNAIFQNIENIEQIKFILNHCLGKYSEPEEKRHTELYVERVNNINILKEKIT